MSKKYFDDKSSDGYAGGVRASMLDVVGAAAAVSDTVFFTTTAAGLYEITASICVTTVGTGAGNTIQLVIKYKDEAAQTITVSATALSGLALGSAAASNLTFTCYLPAGATVSYNETDGGTQTTHAVYNVHIAATLVS